MTEPGEIPVYAVCAECKITKIDSETAASREWSRQHAARGMLDLVAEPIFRSDHLCRGFADVDRPKLTPLKLKGSLAPAPNAAAAYFGMPGDRQSQLSLHRRMRVTPRPAAPVATEDVPQPVVETETRQILDEMTREDAEMGVYDDPKSPVSFTVGVDDAERVAILLDAARIAYTRV